MKRLFGTDGIRASLDDELLQEHNLVRLGNALGIWFTRRTRKPQILMFGDTRPSKDYIQRSITNGLLNHDLTVIWADTLPTGAASILLERTHAEHLDAAIVITASHNPASYNGIKIMTPRGKLDANDEHAIETLFTDNPPESLQKRGVWTTDKDAYEAYLTYLATCTTHSPPHGIYRPRTVVCDCANGAAHTALPDLFSRLGATVHTYNAEGDGSRINSSCGAEQPSHVATAVAHHNADLGITVDGDADRLVAVLPDGRHLTGDEILSVIAQQEPYAHETTLIGTQMTNTGFERWLQQRNKRLIRANVGDKNVTKTLKEHTCLLGGEPSGHIICRDHIHTSDALLAAVFLCNALFNQTPKPEPCSLYYTTSLTCLAPHHQRPPLTHPQIQSLVQTHEQALIPGRVVVRYSGTEPVLRIMAEGASQNTVYQQAKSLQAALAKTLSSLSCEE